MYACFKKIPRRFRQEAFDAIVAKGKFPYGIYARTYCRTYASVGDGPVVCCPLGMVNKVIIEKFDYRGDGVYADWFESNFSLPSTSNETFLLDRILSVDVNEVDIERFMERVDNKGFPTLTSLARAMGVTYDEKQGQ